MNWFKIVFVQKKKTNRIIIVDELNESYQSPSLWWSGFCFIRLELRKIETCAISPSLSLYTYVLLLWTAKRFNIRFGQNDEIFFDFSLNHMPNNICFPFYFLSTEVKNQITMFFFFWLYTAENLSTHLSCQLWMTVELLALVTPSNQTQRKSNETFVLGSFRLLLFWTKITLFREMYYDIW